uniref:PDGF_2 domain-containing protein n=1 Tax=Trichuris muris TaxID=70415 RepID=A0A5S6Q5N5_TRIMR
MLMTLRVLTIVGIATFLRALRADLGGEEVKKLLRKIKTHQEFLTRFHVQNFHNASYLATTHRGSRILETQRSALGITGHHAMTQFKSNSNIQLEKEDIKEETEIIEEPVQSQDSCKVVTVCAPLPIEKEPQLYYFPECIDMPQCLGGCCENLHRCKPTEKEAVRVKVRSWLYLGSEDGRPSFQLSKEFLVDMERHVNCDCNNCDQTPKCEENQVVDGCECKCVNEQDAALCTGDNQYWSKEKCMCECKNNCPPDQRSAIDHDCRFDLFIPWMVFVNLACSMQLFRCG